MLEEQRQGTLVCSLQAGDHVLRHCLVLETVWRRANVRIRDFGSEAEIFVMEDGVKLDLPTRVTPLL